MTGSGGAPEPAGPGAPLSTGPCASGFAVTVAAQLRVRATPSMIAAAAAMPAAFGWYG